MNIRQTLANALMGDQVQRLQEAFQLMQHAVEQPWELPPDQLATQLKELDPWLLQDLLQQLGWEAIGGPGVYGATTEAERQYIVRESIRLYRTSPLAQWAIWLWSSWGLGEGIKVTPNDEAAAEVWDEFWNSRRNAKVLGADRIHELSNWLLVTGNRFLTYYASKLDGKAQVRMVLPSEVTALIPNPEDASEVWFYKREWMDIWGRLQTLYYPDWQTYFSGKADERWELLLSGKVGTNVGAGISAGSSFTNFGLDTSSRRADQINDGTVVCIQHMAYNCKDEGTAWGWPLLTVSRSWVGAHKQFTEARLTVAMAKAMFVRRKKIQGGSRAIDSVMAKIASTLSPTQIYDTNPPAVAGSVELDNARIDTSDLPMTTGASDAKVDNEMFASLALLGAGLFPTSAGMDTARWATALEMDKAQSTLFTQYQTYCSGQFKDMVEIVLSFHGLFGSEAVAIEDKTAQVNIDTFSLADFSSIARVVGGLVGQALLPAVAAQVVPTKTASKVLAMLWRIILQALGVSNVADYTNEDDWTAPSSAPPSSPPAGMAGTGGSARTITSTAPAVPTEPTSVAGMAEPAEEVAALRRIAEAIEREAFKGNGDEEDWNGAARWALSQLRGKE